jgi:hypothetical protein
MYALVVCVCYVPITAVIYILVVCKFDVVMYAFVFAYTFTHVGMHSMLYYTFIYIHEYVHTHM